MRPLVEITDERSARTWLEGKPQHVQVAFAARCALRALPGIAAHTPETLRGLALPIQRTMLVAALRPTAEVTEADGFAASAASRSAASFSYSAAAAAAYSAISSDADLLDSGLKAGRASTGRPLGRR